MNYPIKESLANDIPSHAIEQANQQFWQDDHCKCIVISVCLNSMCYLYLYVRLFHQIKSLWNLILRIMKVSRSMVLQVLKYIAMCKVSSNF